MNKEIERKYSINKLPDDIKISQVIDIEQSYIYKDNNTLIRIRKIEDRVQRKIQYIYTLKTKGDTTQQNDNISSKYEIENTISKEEYEELIVRKISNTILKTRIIAPIEQNLNVEIDIYHDYLDGLLTAEVEFPNELVASEFKKPNWLGEEIGFKELSNGKLSKMNKEEFRAKVNDSFLKNNKAIIEKLKELI